MPPSLVTVMLSESISDSGWSAVIMRQCMTEPSERSSVCMSRISGSSCISANMASQVRSSTGKPDSSSSALSIFMSRMMSSVSFSLKSMVMSTAQEDMNSTRGSVKSANIRRNNGGRVRVLVVVMPPVNHSWLTILSPLGMNEPTFHRPLIYCLTGNLWQRYFHLQAATRKGYPRCNFRLPASMPPNQTAAPSCSNNTSSNSSTT